MTGYSYLDTYAGQVNGLKKRSEEKKYEYES